MTEKQLEQLDKVKSVEKRIMLTDLRDQSDRTLLFGHDAGDNTHHVFLEYGKIHLVVYNDFKTVLHESGAWLQLDIVMPDKKLDPNKCDFEFCSVLKKMGLNLRFSKFSPLVKSERFYGKTY